MPFAKAFTVWAAILVLAIANGLLREAVLVPQLGRIPGFVLSGLLLALVIVGVAYAALPWFGRGRPARFAAIGAAWLVLTLAFEFGFGRFVQGRSWPALLEAYTFKDGNLWPVVLLVTAAAPYLAARMRRWV